MAYMEWKHKISEFKKIDVRGVAGNFFQGIKRQAIELPVESSMKIIQTFDPLPLYEVMEQLGYLNSSYTLLSLTYQ